MIEKIENEYKFLFEAFDSLIGTKISILFV